ncbi:Phosphatidylglycerol/phosphatidylinositol transfer protein [Grifola frondosa]|uniref:Phosphatidylglycerol/phosphatidylinositol transfer protein n=1 Tax=Grifola frondosa TaxID=5627 RepID=A0A1C7M1Y4_GRIFR|nr:Phosphatidylglycerol/phosphatidylinositol transfer protein [Grifola frondosa]
MAMCHLDIISRLNGCCKLTLSNVPRFLFLPKTEHGSKHTQTWDSIYMPLLCPLISLHPNHGSSRFLIILLAAAFSGVYSTGFIERDALPEVNIAPLGGSFQWTNCGQPSDAVQIESIVISPNPPIPGEGLKMTITFVAKEVIESAYADVTIKLGRIKLLQNIIDICEELQDNNSSVQCPVNEGRHEFEHTVTLPIEIPLPLSQ